MGERGHGLLVRDARPGHQQRMQRRPLKGRLQVAGEARIVYSNLAGYQTSDIRILWTMGWPCEALPVLQQPLCNLPVLAVRHYARRGGDVAV